MLAKTFAKVARDTGWRPRRSIVFASWAAEEFGLIGSTEWVEENLPKLMSRAVAYLNTDMCVSGPDLEATASPAYKAVLEEAAKSVPDPADAAGQRTYYDYWKGGRGGPSSPGGGGDNFFSGTQFGMGFAANYQLQGSGGGGSSTMTTNGDKMIGDASSESDHGPFCFRAGVPVMNVRFGRSGDPFPLRHTKYDDLNVYLKLLDPNLHNLATCARLMAEVVRRTADSLVLPHDFRAYADRMRLGTQVLKAEFRSGTEESIGARQAQNITVEFLESAISRCGKRNCENCSLISLTKKTNLQVLVASR